MNLLEALFQPSKSSQVRIDCIKMTFAPDDYIVQPSISGEDDPLKKFIVAFMKKEGYPYEAEVAVDDGTVKITVDSPHEGDFLRRRDLKRTAEDVFDKFVELFYIRHVAFIKASLIVEGTTFEDMPYRTTLTQECMQ